MNFKNILELIGGLVYVAILVFSGCYLIVNNHEFIGALLTGIAIFGVKVRID